MECALRSVDKEFATLQLFDQANTFYTESQNYISYPENPDYDAYANQAIEVDAMVTEQLSDRELDVLRAIASGQANKDLANSLHISVATTRNHVQHILKKLSVHSKLEAVALAFRNGWA